MNPSSYNITNIIIINNFIMWNCGNAQITICIYLVWQKFVLLITAAATTCLRTRAKIETKSGDTRRATADARGNSCRAKRVPRARRPNTKSAATTWPPRHTHAHASTMIIKIIARLLLLSLMFNIIIIFQFLIHTTYLLLEEDNITVYRLLI